MDYRMNWATRLQALSKEELENPPEPAATEIALEFLREEVVPRLQRIQRDAIEQGCRVEFNPDTPIQQQGNRIFLTFSISKDGRRGDIFSYRKTSGERDESGFYIKLKITFPSGHQNPQSLLLYNPDLYELLDKTLDEFRAEFIS